MLWMKQFVFMQNSTPTQACRLGGAALTTIASADPDLYTESSCIPSQVHSKGLL